MTAAVSTAHLTGQMVMAGSPVHGTGRRAIAICDGLPHQAQHQPVQRAGAWPARLYRAIGGTMNLQAVETRLLVDVEANPESTAHITGEAS